MRDRQMDTASLDASTTAAEAISGIDLHGHRALVTGASSGIGAETVRALASAGAEVTLAVRNVEAGKTVAAGIAARYGDERVRVTHLDLADLGSVRAFADQWSGPLHLLINNAGVMALPERTLNNAGHELHFATNHLGHFALATWMHDALAAGGHDKLAVEGPLSCARIVSLSSRGHLRASVDFDDIDFVRRTYESFIAYGQSKTANVLFAVEAARRWSDDGITANAVHPGAILETNLSRHMTAEVLRAATTNANGFKTTAQGAATTIVVATSPALAGVSARYFEDCHEAQVLPPNTPDIAQHANGVAWYALDANIAEKLWDISMQLIE
ncbi:oxidoreductase [Mycobacterium saskatchewanense]|uniref:Probable oxidoreductase n=2 Tax=Mycobacterium saskatchewanense TaxID=220927 RepID=A0AAJ3NVF4_9MYCO|nr:oxidoreductase [Mycobacterium saskatchewanense]